MWRAIHDVEVISLKMALRNTEAALDGALDHARYWQDRAEKLLDHALFKANAVTAPVFQPPPPPQVDPMMRVLGALGKTEVELKPPAAPVTPMP